MKVRGSLPSGGGSWFQMFCGGIASILCFHDVVFFAVVVCSILFWFEGLRQATIAGLLEKS
jgi:hypothetical protein